MNSVPEESKVATRGATERAFAVVGFIGLVAFGVALAMYSSRFVPETVGRVGTAAVALSSIFTQAEPTLAVVPTQLGEVVLENAGDVRPTSAPLLPITATESHPATAKAPTIDDAPLTTPSAPTPSSAIYPISGSSAIPATAHTLSGLADLEAKIIATGYLATTSTASFVATSTVPRGGRPAVTFVIKNVGTNVAAAGWRFTAAIPTQGAYVFTSPAQQALNPGDSIEYTLGFDQASPGSGRSISIVANSDRSIAESNTENNSSTATINVLGS